MKNLTLFFIYIFISYTVVGQTIPNASFEEWEVVDGYERPVGWFTNQDSTHEGLVKSDISIDGDSSLLLLPSEEDSSFFGNCCESKASTIIDIISPMEENQSFYFYVKSIPDSTFILYNHPPYFYFSAEMYLNGEYLGNDYLFHIGEVPEFQLFEVPITHLNIDKIVLRIHGGSTDNLVDGCQYYSYSWFDGIKIDDSTMTPINKVNDKSDLEIFPNPSFGKIEIQGDWKKYQSYQVYDLLGKELEKGILQSAELMLKSKGILFLVLKSNRGNQSVFKIINQ